MLKSDQDQEAFFQEVQDSFLNTIETHFEKHERLFFREKGIVDVIGGDMLFHPDAMDGISKAVLSAC